MTKPLEILSLGAGRQSTTAALKSFEGEFPPLDAAIFADTQREPASVYRHLEYLQGRFDAAGVPLHVVTAGDLGTAALTIEQRSGGLPVFLANPDGSVGHARRQCTADYKVAVIERKVRELRGDRHVNMWIGISLDEIQRMRHSRKKYITNVYPLVDARMTVWDCQRWLAARSVDAPRSACYFCPFHNNHEWRRLRDEEPEEFAKAIEFERDLQRVHGSTDDARSFKGVPFLHRSMVPLAEVDLSTAEDHGQMTFDGCGVLCPADDEEEPGAA